MRFAPVATHSPTNTASYDRRGQQIASIQDAGDLATHLNITQRNTYDAFGRLLSWLPVVAALEAD